MIKQQIFLFPIAALAISLCSYLYPSILADLGFAIVPLLGLVMFSMGMSLHINDFKAVFNRPRLIFSGLVMQYLLMPFIAWCLAMIFGLPMMLATGLILVGSCPGGTASNIICYLAKGDVALSISLTAISTVFAVFLTPLLVELYVDEVIIVPALDMMKSLLLIILLPVLSGILVNHICRERLSAVQKGLPVVSMASVVLIIGIIIAKSHTSLQDIGLLVVIAVVAHNLLGLLSGYGISRLLKYDEVQCRTLAIEVGMQNSGLGIVLANQYFSALAALPGAVFSIWHNISGAILAGFWRRHDEYQTSKQ